MSYLSPCGASREKPSLIVVMNDWVKEAPVTDEFLQNYHQTISSYYGDIYATDGTAKFIGKYFNVVFKLGHGPIIGDHNTIQKVLELIRDGKEVHVFAFLDWRYELHEYLKQYLRAMLEQLNAVWFPTPAAASVYLARVANGSLL